MKPRKHHRIAPIIMRRILAEGAGVRNVRLNLSDAFENLPMTIDQEDIWVEAEFSKGQLTLIVYSNETINPRLGPMGGNYIDEAE